MVRSQSFQHYTPPLGTALTCGHLLSAAESDLGRIDQMCDNTLARLEKMGHPDPYVCESPALTGQSCLAVAGLECFVG